MDRLGEVAFEVDAGPRVVEAVGGEVLPRLPVHSRVELRHPADAEGELAVLGLPAEAVVVVVVVGLERELAEAAVADLLGPDGGGRVAAGGLRTAPRRGGQGGAGAAARDPRSSRRARRSRAALPGRGFTG